MKTRLAKLPELEKNNISLFKDKSDLLEQIGKLTIELKDAKDSYVKVDKELASLTGNLSKVQKEYEALEIENSDLLSKQADMIAENHKVALRIQTASESTQENTKLKALTSQLKANQAAPAVGGVVTDNKDQAAMEAQIRALEDQKKKLQSALDEWTELAKVRAPRAPFSFECVMTNIMAALIQGV
jgi:chromosome segregation ATPase